MDTDPIPEPELDYNAEMIALDQGELRPTHLRTRKPFSAIVR